MHRILKNYYMTIFPIIGVAYAMSGELYASDRLDQDTIKRITQNWQCKWCPDNDVVLEEGRADIGAGVISNNSYKHGNYTGRDEEGAFAIISGEYSRRYPTGYYEEIQATELGLDSRQLKIQAGLQGVADLGVGYTELPSLNSDSARSPYTGSVSKNLPSTWVTGSTTQDMTELESALKDTNVSTQRKSLSLAARYQQSDTISYDLNFKRDTKEGNKTAGLALGNSFATARSIVVNVPIEYVTNQAEMKINYTSSQWQSMFSYKLSDFSNANKYVSWENAFSQPTNVSSGQAALEPDNSMHQFALAGAYQFSSTLQSVVSISMGRMLQDDAFLPYTTNSNLSPFTLPRESLDGEVNTFNSSLKLNWQYTPQWHFNFQYQQHEQDNDTARATYDYIVADTSQSTTARANFPYSFRQRKISINSQFRLNKHNKIRFGAAQDEYDRTYQEVEATRESNLFANYQANVSENLKLTLRVQQQNRNGDNYTPVTEITPPENPLLRKYNLADRKRNSVGVELNYDALRNLRIGFYADYADDDYADSSLGLQQSKQATYVVDTQVMLTQAMILNLAYSISQLDSSQAGSQNFSTQTWIADNDDQIDVAQIGFIYRLMGDKLKLGADYAYVDSLGKINVTGSGSLPSLTSNRQTFTVHGDYLLDKKSSIVVYYSYEKYDENNWAIDNVVPNTVPNVLTMGDVSPSYNIGVLALCYKRQF